MISRHIDTITDCLATMNGQAFFRPQTGALQERLKQGVLDDAGSELAETPSDGEFGLEVSVACQEGDSQPTVSFRVDRPGVVHSSQVAVTLLADDALEDLAGYLLRLSENVGENAPSEEAPVAGGTPSRDKADTDYHEKGPASARLKVSPEWLKRIVPCTDYSYEEIDGKKYIREYYWSKDLIERLFKIKSTKTTPEDLQYVAAECCEGDLEWARDLIARLKSPNRPEAPAKESGQKNQRKPVQAQAPQAPANERSRQRSRHKKPFRQPGKDGGAKSDPTATQKRD